VKSPGGYLKKEGQQQTGEREDTPLDVERSQTGFPAGWSMGKRRSPKKEKKVRGGCFSIGQSVKKKRLVAGYRGV